MKNPSKYLLKAALTRALTVIILILSILETNFAITDAAAAPMLSKTTQNIVEGKTFKLEVNNKISKASYVWSSSNKEIASVSKTGTVTGIKKGNVTITCKVKTPKNTYKLTCKVTVRKPASKVSITNKVTALKLGQEYGFTIKLSPSGSNDTANWTSSNKEIANPDKNGKFTALKKGEVTITVKTLSGKKDSVTFTVVDNSGTVIPTAAPTREVTVIPTKALPTPTAGVTPTAEATPTAEVTPTAETTPTAEVTPTAETTPTAEVTPTAETTPTVEATPTGEVTPTAEVTPTTEVTPTPTSPAVNQNGTTYYVDSLKGDDSNDGTSTKTPWQTLSRVNATTFTAGDKILLKAGSVWNNAQLSPMGSGGSGNPVIIDMYGEGNKPVINANLKYFAGVYLNNQEYWEINNLEVTNFNGTYRATTSGYYVGIHFRITNSPAAYSHLYVRNCYIHDVDGNKNIADGLLDKGTGGISFVVDASGTSYLGHFNDIDIENNTITRVVRTGIEAVWSSKAENYGMNNMYYSTNIRIAGNIFSYVAGDSIINAHSKNVIVKNNLSTYGCSDNLGNASAGMWPWSCDDVVYENNECAYLQNQGADCCAWDFDMYNRNITYQYNYSHDNAQGQILIMPDNNYHSVFRYNVSENELLNSNSTGKGGSDTWFYNNVFYKDWGWNYANYNFNNIYYKCTDVTYPSAKTNVHDYNCYFGGTTFEEPHAVLKDPKFAGFEPADGFSSCAGLKLQPDSPCINTGLSVPDPIGVGGRDFFGSTLYSGAPDIGVSEYQESPAVPIENPDFERAELTAWAVSGDAAISPDNINTGNHSIRLGNGGLAEQVIKVLPNTTYTLSGYGLAPAGGEVRIGVKNYGGAESYKAITGVFYTKGSVTFTTGSNNTTAAIYVSHPSAAGNAYADDLSIQMTPAGIGNTGFEAPILAPWYTWNDAEASAAKVHTGLAGLRIGAAPASIEQRICVEPDTTYVVKCYVLAPAGEKVNLGVKGYSGYEIVETAGNSDNYSPVSITFTTGSADIYATIYAYHESGTGSVYVDDFTIEKQANIVTVDPYDQYQKNWEGWGTSLCWFGNKVGGWSDVNKNAVADLLFGADNLGFNIARYNIGGGDDPSHSHMRAGGDIPGYKALETSAYDWTADANQRWFLQAAKERGANIFEAFSNSPPYWMTNSGCAAGSVNGTSNNLKDGYYDAFADYLTDVVKHFNDNWGITFRTLEPLNEPSGTWWKANGGQEGCYFSRDAQKKLINATADSLAAKGLSTALSASDESVVSDTTTSWNYLDSSTKSKVEQINTHTYGGNTIDNDITLSNTAIADNKRLWMSEIGIGGSVAHDHNNMQPGIALASEINQDLKYMRPSAFVYWQAVEDEQNMLPGRENSNWGLIHADFEISAENYYLTKQYYVMMNYAKFIKAGFRLIGNGGGNTVTAYDPDTDRVVIVSYNDKYTPVLNQYDLSQYTATGSTVTVYRTSLEENFVKLPDIAVSDKLFTDNVPGYSVTTYVIDGCNYTNPGDNIALKKAASADSAQSGSGASNAVDGLSTTRWCADDGKNGHWLKISLKGETNLTGSEIVWEEAGNYKYKIETSTDNSSWTTVVDKTNTAGTYQIQSDTFTAAARYVRITVTGLPLGRWASIREFRLFGSEDDSIPDGNSGGNIKLDGTSAGRTFEGEGVLSGGGGNSRLLIDYPEPYRSDILDYLFKPDFGAGFPHLKLEVGGDINSTSGTEPSHARTEEENATPYINRGYETWIMQEAKKRNSDIMLDLLEWGAPGWVGNMWSQKNADYLVSYIKAVKNQLGLDINYVGGNQNENYKVSSTQLRDYIVNILRPALDGNGLSNVKIVAADVYDNKWSLADQFQTDAAYKNAVDVLGSHYVNSATTENAQNSGKPLWESEGWTGVGDWSGAYSLAQTLNENYINGKITKTNIWHLIDSCYGNLPWSGSGVMAANSPWSGYYEVSPAIWAVAHTNQFAKPGWKYLDSGCGITETGASYVTMKKPDNSGDYSVIIVTGSKAEKLDFQLTGGLSASALHVWKSNSTEQFIQQNDITPLNNKFSIDLEPDSIYSLTTTTGQQKGEAANPIPEKTSFPGTYTEDFESYPAGVTPKYTQDEGGAFEVSDKYGYPGEKVLRQVITGPLIKWDCWGSKQDPYPVTEFGDRNWKDYVYSADVLVENSGWSWATIYGRVNKIDPGYGDDGMVYGYWLSVEPDNKWNLKTDKGTLAEGTFPVTANTWHNLKLSMKGSNIRCYIDNILVADVTDNTYASGMAGLGTGWNNAQFDNISVTASPIDVAIGKTVTTDSQQDGNLASNAVDGNPSTRWCANDGDNGHWIKVDLGSLMDITGTEINWEQNINYKYKIETSADDETWDTVVDKTSSATAAKGQIDDFKAAARYVRLTVSEVADWQWASLNEFYVYGTLNNFN